MACDSLRHAAGRGVHILSALPFRSPPEKPTMPRSVQQATHILVLGARLYRELALSALRILPGRS